MDRDAYLGRIGYRGGREPNAVNLAALVRAHRLAVPYETLDLWRRRRTTLQLEEIYDKIVTRRRGGYCFELNGLFAWLLLELGYNVREYAGRWLLGQPPSSVPMRLHERMEVRGRRFASAAKPDPLKMRFDVHSAHRRSGRPSIRA